MSDKTAPLPPTLVLLPPFLQPVKKEPVSRPPSSSSDSSGSSEYTLAPENPRGIVPRSSMAPVKAKSRPALRPKDPVRINRPQTPERREPLSQNTKPKKKKHMKVVDFTENGVIGHYDNCPCASCNAIRVLHAEQALGSSASGSRKGKERARDASSTTTPTIDITKNGVVGHVDGCACRSCHAARILCADQAKEPSSEAPSPENEPRPRRRVKRHSSRVVTEPRHTDAKSSSSTDKNRDTRAKNKAKKEAKRAAAEKAAKDAADLHEQVTSVSEEKARTRKEAAARAPWRFTFNENCADCLALKSFVNHHTFHEHDASRLGCISPLICSDCAEFKKLANAHQPTCPTNEVTFAKSLQGPRSVFRTNVEDNLPDRVRLEAFLPQCETCIHLASLLLQHPWHDGRIHDPYTVYPSSCEECRGIYTLFKSHQKNHAQIRGAYDHTHAGPIFTQAGPEGCKPERAPLKNHAVVFKRKATNTMAQPSYPSERRPGLQERTWSNTTTAASGSTKGKDVPERNPKPLQWTFSSADNNRRPAAKKKTTTPSPEKRWLPAPKPPKPTVEEFVDEAFWNVGEFDPSTGIRVQGSIELGMRGGRPY